MIRWSSDTDEIMIVNKTVECLVGFGGIVVVCAVNKITIFLTLIYIKLKRF